MSFLSEDRQSCHELSVFLFKIFLTKYDDFHYCFSLGCFKITQNFESLGELKKTEYMTIGLNNYNHYIRKNLKLRINHLEAFYSKIISDSKESMDGTLELILGKLEKGQKLDLLRFLAELSGSTGISDILTSDQLSVKIKELMPFIISVITATITILSFILKK